MKKILGLLAIAVLLFAPAANADTFYLNVISGAFLPVGTVAGTVTLTQNGTNSVDVVVELNPAIWFHDQGLSSFSFNGPATGITAVITDGDGGTWGVLNAGKDNQDGLGDFRYFFNCSASPNGCTGQPQSLAFTVTSTSALSLADLEVLSTGGGTHVDFAANIAQQTSGCTGVVGGGNGTGQSTASGGFVSGSVCAGETTVPEPASMLLFGTGLLGAGLFGRRLRK